MSQRSDYGDKQTDFNFPDKVGTIYIGMKVYVTNGQMGHHHRIDEREIDKIGREYVTLDNGRRFRLADGSEKTEYSKGRMWSSMESYLESTKRERTIEEVKQQIRELGFKMTYDQAVAIKEILK